MAWDNATKLFEQYGPRELIVRCLAMVLVLLSLCSTNTAAWSQTECKVCRETLQACLKAHSKDACNNDYSICMRHCRKK
jgi:hypothetical protein